VGFAAGTASAASALARMRRIEREVHALRPDVFLAVAWSEPNTLLGLRLRRMGGIRRIFFAPPQLWAWGRWRAALLRRGFDALLCLYPGEAKFLRGLGLAALFAGNPLLEHLAPHFNARRRGSSKTIALLAGSRRMERSRHAALLKEFAEIWCRSHPEYRTVWLFASGAEAEAARPVCGLAVGGEARYAVLAEAEAAVVASGTASLETALLGTPQVVFYSLPRLEKALVRTLTRVRRFALPNVILERDAVPELLNPGADELVQAVEGALAQPQGFAALASRLREELAPPLDNSKSLFRIILS